MPLWTHGGADPNLNFVLPRTAPVFALKSINHWDRLSNPSMLTLWEIMTNGRFESDTHVVLKKLDFFLATITEEDRVLHDRDYKWLRQIGDRRFFLPNMERMYPLAYLQHTSVLLAQRPSTLVLMMINSCSYVY